MSPLRRTAPALALVLLLPATAASAASGTVFGSRTTWVSLSDDDRQSDGQTVLRTAVSGSGRYVAWDSSAPDLVPGDTNGGFDVFLRDRRTGTTTRVSVGAHARQASGSSTSPALSADASRVAFTSTAPDLVPGDTNGTGDVFLRDRRTGTTTRVSVGPGGRQGDGRSEYPAITPDGQVVAFSSTARTLVDGDTNGDEDVFVRDLRTGRTTRVSVATGGRQAHGKSFEPAVSADGRTVAFWSTAADLVPGDTDGVPDVFVHDLGTGRTQRVSVGPGGQQADEGSTQRPSVSGDGTLVAFASSASTLVPGDTNGVGDVFVRDLRRGTTRRVSVDRAGGQADGGSLWPSLSRDGTRVAFASAATDLLRGRDVRGGGVYVRDLREGVTREAALRSDGAPVPGTQPQLSGDGLAVAWTYGLPVFPDDTNDSLDVFVRS